MGIERKMAVIVILLMLLGGVTSLHAQRCGGVVAVAIFDSDAGNGRHLPISVSSVDTTAFYGWQLVSVNGTYAVAAFRLTNYGGAVPIRALAVRKGEECVRFAYGCEGSYRMLITRRRAPEAPPDSMVVDFVHACDESFGMDLEYSPGRFSVLVCDTVPEHISRNSQGVELSRNYRPLSLQHPGIIYGGHSLSEAIQRSMPSTVIRVADKRHISIEVLAMGEGAIGDAKVSVQLDGHGAFIPVRFDSATRRYVLYALPDQYVVVNVEKRGYPSERQVFRNDGTGRFGLPGVIGNVIRVCLAPSGSAHYFRLGEKIPYVGNFSRVAVALAHANDTAGFSLLLDRLGLVEDWSHDTIRSNSDHYRVRGMAPTAAPILPPPLVAAGVRILRRRDGAVFAARGSRELAELRSSSLIGMAGSVVSLNRRQATICDNIVGVYIASNADSADIVREIRKLGFTIVADQEHYRALLNITQDRVVVAAADPAMGRDVGRECDRIMELRDVLGVTNNVRQFSSP